MIRAILLAFFLPLGARASSPRKKASPLPTTPVAPPAWAAEVYSSNIVGYTKLEIKPGLNMIAIPFVDIVRDADGFVQNKDINNIFDNDESVVNANRISDNADQMWFWDNVSQGYKNYYFMTDRRETFKRWENGSGETDVREDIGAGFFFQNQGDASYTVTLSGEVNTADTEVEILPGLNFICNPYPVDLPLNDGTIDWTGAYANRDAFKADQMWFWDAEAQGYVNLYYMTDRRETYKRWENGSGEYETVTIPAYEGFFYNYAGDGAGFTLTLKYPLSAATGE